MGRIAINLGTPPEGRDGDPVRTAFEKVNQMTAEIYEGAGAKKVVASSTDTSEGRVLTVGYGGLGASNNAPYIGVSVNPDNYVLGHIGLWGTWQTPWAPSNVTGWLSVQAGESGACFQTLTVWNSGEIWTRYRNGTNWSVWSKFFSDNNSLGDPQLAAGARGLMSASVVSGWQVFKYLNGELKMISPFIQLEGGPFQGGVERVTDIPIPIALVGSIKFASAMVVPQTSYDYTVPSCWLPGSINGVRLVVRNGFGAAQTFSRTIMVTGVWK